MLFCNIDLLDENFECKRGQYVGVKDSRIAYIGDTEPQEDYGERYDGKHRLLMSGFFNVHSHAPMRQRTTVRSFPSRKCCRAVRFRSRICISSSTA